MPMKKTKRRTAPLAQILIAPTHYRPRVRQKSGALRLGHSLQETANAKKRSPDI